MAFVILNVKKNYRIDCGSWVYGVCVLALENLDYMTLFGKQIKVTASKHLVVQMPKEGTVVCTETAFTVVCLSPLSCVAVLTLICCCPSR